VRTISASRWSAGSLSGYFFKNHFAGKCIAVVHRINDDDDKLIVVLADKNYSDDQIKALTKSVERSFILIIIPDPSSTLRKQGISR